MLFLRLVKGGAFFPPLPLRPVAMFAILLAEEECARLFIGFCGMRLCGCRGSLVKGKGKRQQNKGKFKA